MAEPIYSSPYTGSEVDAVVGAYKAGTIVSADDLSAETERAKAAEQINANAISAETSRAELAEQTNASSISKLNTITLTATADNWVGNSAPYTQTVAVSGVTAGQSFNAPYIDPTGTRETDIANAEALACIDGGGSVADGTITLICMNSKPTIDLTMKLDGRSDGTGKVAMPAINQDLGTDLLWTNPSPDSAFAAQTVAVDLSKYRFLAIDPIYGTTLAKHCGLYTYPKGVSAYVYVINPTNPSAAATRLFSSTDTGVIFEACASGNDFVVPHEIYGVK